MIRIILMIVATIIWIRTMRRDYIYQKFRVEYDRTLHNYDVWLLELGLYDKEHKINNNFKWNTPNRILYSLKPINMENMVSAEIREKLSYTGLSIEEYEKVIAFKKRKQKLERICIS